TCAVPPAASTPSPKPSCTERRRGGLLPQRQLFLRDAERTPIGRFRHDALEGGKLHRRDMRLRRADRRPAFGKALGGSNHLAAELRDRDVARAEIVARA